MSAIIPIVVALIIVGFILWALRKILAKAPIDPEIKSWADLLLVIFVGAIIVFYIVIPLIQMLGHLSLPGLK